MNITPPLTQNRYNFWYAAKYSDANPANRAAHRANGTRSQCYLKTNNPDNFEAFLSANLLAFTAYLEAEARQAIPADAISYYKKAERWYTKAGVLAFWRANRSTADRHIWYNNLALRAYDKREEIRAVIENLEKQKLSDSDVMVESSSQLNVRPAYQSGV